MATKKTFELFIPYDSGEMIHFKFKFKLIGGATMEVWSNGTERTDHKKSGQFGGIIQSGSYLKVTFKVWDGPYSIEYSCEAMGTVKTDPANPSPLAGSVNGNQPKTIDVFIKL